ncbi:MAG TPA: carboxylesterase/lipase family protein [Myxococcaceae bacterium]|nr:carboxylesterase/lipase family protein [Myxococcaceae bacterium]
MTHRLPLRPVFLPLVCLGLLTGCAHESAATRPNAPAPVVATESGPVRGIALAKGGARFLDIPFAAPPTGARRFRAPEPPAPWTEPRDATRPGKSCPQVDPFRGGGVDADEDCLHLNVWTPSLDKDARAPVMVFIHGGGFLFGSNSMDLYDGTALSDAGVVVVSINYRIGALGFLAHPALSAEEGAHQSSSNYGLMDQQLALRWVRANIARFGGDPERVTLFGESAGAVSIGLQMISPGAEGLFHRAIFQSGTGHITRVPLRDPGTAEEDSAEERGQRLARDVGCTGADVPACLRAVPAEKLVAAGETNVDLVNRRIAFGPTVDGHVVPDQPRSLYAEAKHLKIPVLLGTNEDEGSLFTIRAKIDSAARYEEILRAHSPENAEKMLALYPVKENGSPRGAYNHVLRDALFLCPARQLARTMVEHGQKVYAYQFTHAPKNFFTWWNGLGAFHAAELPFVFGMTRGLLRIDTDKERALSATMIGYWTRFATSGDPNGPGAPQWPEYTRQAEPHLVLDTTGIAQSAQLDKAHCDALDGMLK